MDSIEVQEDVISDPSKHLLTLDCNSSVTLTAIENNFDPPKSARQVRFSDEVETILYDSGDEKNVNNPSSHEESSDDKNDTEMNADLLTCSNANKMYISTEETEFITCELPFENVEDTFDSIDNGLDDSSVVNSCAKIHSTLQEIEESVNLNIDPNNDLLVDNFENNLMKSATHPEETAVDLNDVTKQVENLALENSSSENVTVSIFKPVLESSDFNIHPDENFIEIDELTSNNSGDSSVISKSRIKSKLYNQKQSWKLNSVLTENSCCSSASELKSAVFKAWCEVKNKTKRKSVETAVSNEKTVSNKQHSLNNAYLTWKKSKVEALKKVKKDKSTMHFPNMQQEISKNTREEIELAFKAWKKKKDEMLKQKMLEKFDNEQEEIGKSSMEKTEKRMEADAAFTSWKQHKSDLIKREKKKRVWIMQKKREEEEKKSMRDQEALISYHQWLESKSFVKCHIYSPFKAKPPWLPPGK